MKKRFLAAALALGMIFCLTACGGGKQPTAEELLKRGLPDEAKSWTASIELKLAAEIDMGDMFSAETDATDGEDATDGSETSTMMSMGAQISATTERDENLTHMTGKSIIDMFGMSSEIPMETWAKTENGVTTTWTYNTDEGEWDMAENNAADDANNLSDLFDVSELNVTDSTVAADGNYWVVSGKTSAANLASLGVDELMSSMVGDESADMALDVKLYYEKKGNDLVKVEMTCDNEALTEFSFSLAMSKVGSTSLKLPTDLPTEVSNRDVETEINNN